ncbi:MAG TPA: CHAP domain-containing protein [Nocardioides sp.]|nr:CHAP domain-containing protein [Nocardioides sp.]
MRNRGPVLRWGTSVAASALFATLLVAVGVTGRVEVPVTRSAGVTDLCSGWSGCSSAGYSDAGYGAVSGRMYWNMYSGHNCTNYVAYRMIKAGMSPTRPWVGGGNASEWGLYMSRITDQTPSVGSVAWWARYDNGSGSAGHVGYVEKVVSSSEIIISMDSWGGTFHWRRITKDSGRWPTGFIHFVDKKLTQTAPASIAGTPQVGTQLTANPGTWTPSATLSYQWFAGGVAVTGATARTYTPVAADYGKQMTVRVTAKRSGYSSVAVTTRPTEAVIKGTLTVTDPPAIGGEPFVGKQLVGTSGVWNRPDTDFEWRWFVDGVRVTDAATPRFTLQPAHVGRSIRLVVVARKDGYRAEKAGAEEPVGPVFAGAVTAGTPTAVAGSPRVDGVLRVVPGTYQPADVTRAYQWLRDGAPIEGATAPRYRLTASDLGHLVTVRTSLSKPDFRPLTEETSTTQRVITVPTIAVATAVRGRDVVVTARVTAPGVSPVTGQVQIRVGRYLKTVNLVGGRASTVRFGPLARGEKPVGVHYLGTDLVLQKWYSGAVVVR